MSEPAVRLLDSLNFQAEIYEKLLERCLDESVDPEQLTRFAQESQDKARSAGEQVLDVVAAWGEISIDLEPQLRSDLMKARTRVHEAITGVLSRNEVLLGLMGAESVQDQQLVAS